MAYTGVVSGAVSSVNALAANQMPDVDRVLYLLKPYQSPIFQWLYFSQGANKAEKIINTNAKFSWFEDELYPYQTTVSAMTVSGDHTTAVTVGDSSIFNSDDVVLFEKSEQMAYVSGTGSSLQFTTLDGTALTAVTSGNVKIIGSRNHEFNTPRTSVSTKEVEKYNYAKIFSETVTTTGRYQAGDKYTNGKTHKEQVRKKITEMKFQIERYLLFSTERGSVNLGSGSNYRFTYGYGLLGFISTNKTSYAGSLSEAAFDSYLQSVFAKGSNVKRHYAGANQIAAINNIVKNKYQVVDTDGKQKSYGSNVGNYITPFGMLKLYWNPVMDGKFASYGFTLDEENVKLRYMASDDKGSRKFRIEENVETPGTDGEQTKILFDLGLQVTNEEECGILYDSTV